MFQYLPADATTPAQLIQSLWQEITPGEMLFYLRYLDRILVASNDFCQMDADFRGSVTWLLDLLRDFTERSTAITLPNN